MKNVEVETGVEHLHEPQQVVGEHQLQQVVWIIEVSAKYLRHQAYHRRAAGPAQSMQKFEDLKLNFPWLSTDWKFVACKL